METAFTRWISAALEELGCSNAFEQQPLEVEASFRRFYRVSPHTHGISSDESYVARRSYVAMHSPPEQENNIQFARLAEVFADHGVGVPTICASNEPLGYFLLTDLGTRDLRRAYADHDREAALTAAINTLVVIQAVRHEAIPPYEVTRFREELEIFREWFVEGLLALQFPRSQLYSAFAALIQVTQDQPQCCVHRDFHCKNLLYAADGRFGVVDFQDALIGPVSYDLASLLRDCYHRFSESEITHWRKYYLATTPFELDERRFAELLDLSAVQRQLKAIGIFSRLHLRDGKSSHLAVILPVLDELIEVAGQYPVLHDLAGWLSDIRPKATTVLTELL
ncbi:MAG: phosphotransferase [Gammaproteobacteria bacterium]|nr:phosphotransferase [Gammaproteobacteria bacterium]